MALKAMLLEQLWRDTRLAVRRLAAAPVFTAFAIVSLALGLGVTTAVYSTISSVLWRGSSIEDADRLAVVTRSTRNSAAWRWTMSKSDFDELQTAARSVPAVAASSLVFGVLNDGTQTSTFLAQAVTGNFFATARVPIALGRGIQDADDRSGADPVVVLSHEFWQSNAGADREIVGRTVRINGNPFVVIGVVAERFQNARDTMGQVGVVNGDAWMPLADKSIVRPIGTGTQTTNSDDADLTVIARIPAGIGVQAVATEMSNIGTALDQSSPLPHQAGGAPVARSWSATTAAAIAHEQMAGSVTAGGAIVLLVGLVLVVACTNLANLTIGRGTSRAHEFSVRRALGASRARLVREQCAESVVLAAFGGLGALLVARILMNRVTTDIPLGNMAVISIHPTLSASALVAAGGALLLSLIVFGLIPALQLTRASLRERLAAQAVSAPPSRWKGRRHLIVWQVAISTALMLVGFASARTVTADARHDPGFDLQHLAVASVNFSPMHWDTDRAKQAIAALDTAAHTQPGFTSVALMTGLPMGFGARLLRGAQVWAVDRATTEAKALFVRTIPATPGVFPTLGVPILRGRGFDDRDTAATSRVIVTSELVAHQLFGSADVVGRQLRYQGPSDATPQTVEVIGVTRDTDTLTLLDRRFGAVYVPLAQQDTQTVFIVGRTAGDPAPMVRTFTGIVRQADPDLAVEYSSTGPMVMTPTSVLLRVVAILSGGLSLLAITLAMLGLYGVLSHVVTRRTREIGVRLALGAEASRVRRMIVGEGLHPVIWGLGLGFIVGTGARVVLRAIDVARNISAIDPLAFTIAAVTLVTAGLFACYFPAHRASKVDPNVALRDL